MSWETIKDLLNIQVHVDLASMALSATLFVIICAFTWSSCNG